MADLKELRRLAEAAIKAAQEPEIDITKTQAYYEALEQFEDFANPAAIIKLLDEIAVANARIAELESNKCETCFDNYAKAIGKLTERAERAEAECRRLRVCGNCRHFSTGYTEDLCAKPSRYGETTRQSTCDDWEVI